MFVTVMLRVFTIIAILEIFLFLSNAEENCVTRVEKVSCLDRENAQLLYTCESNSEDDCRCLLDNPLLSDIGWFKTCHRRNSLKIRKKKVRKRETGDQNLCGTISPPKPGKVSCSVSRDEIKCIGTCGADFEFIDDVQEKVYSCQYVDGVWNPGNDFPLCKPKCDPPCENGGTCISVNLCSCTNDYRGNACQYPITLCGFSKNRQPSNWKCNHTRTETICDISCHAPDTPESLRDVYIYGCSTDGVWNPPLPSCVQVPVCEEPTNISHGQWHLLIGHIYSVGSRVGYKCEKGFILQGERYRTCRDNATWSSTPPVCLEQKAANVCEDPGDVLNGYRNMSTAGFFPKTEVKYACNQDFALLGEPVIKCLSTGLWSSGKPQCVPINDAPVFCTKPNVPKNSVLNVAFPDQYSLDAVFNKDIPVSQRLYVMNFARGQEIEFSSIPERTFVVGTRVQYKCKNRFYKLYGSEYQTCLSSQTWSGYQPACVPECGRSDSPKTPFIVNGNSTHIGQWPWQVGLALKTRKGLQLLCGGALINEMWILTAAHCVARKLSNVPMDSAELLIFTGKYYRSFDRDDEYVQVKKVRQIIIHEEYDFVHFDVDIALLQLESAIELTTRVQPICLPTEDTTRENVRDRKEGIVIGWGLKEDGKYSDLLKETVLPVVGHDKCEEAYREGLRSVTITKNMFCAGHDSGKTDTCNGDSGGPLMFAVGPANDIRWYVEGLVSWGAESGCGTALRYSGFTKVGRFVPWINMFI